MTEADAPRSSPTGEQSIGLLDVGWPEVWSDADADVGVDAPGSSLDEHDGPARLRRLAQTDFPVLAIPKQFGGRGFGLLEMAAAQRAVARVDPSAAIALNMHSLTIGLMADYWARHRDTSWFLLEGIAGKHALVASAFAEPGGSANFLESRSTAHQQGRGYVVTGTKYPCSLATTAELFCLNAAVEGTSETIVALCPAASPGLTVTASWPSHGMRASDTGRVELLDVEIDDRLVFHRAPAGSIDDTVVAGVLWFSVLLAATYHGIMTALVGHATSTSRGPIGSQRQQLIGRAARDVAVLGLATQRTAAAWEDGTLQGSSALAAAMALRASLSDTRDRAITALTPVLGSRLYTSTDPAGALALDLLAAHHHPPSLLVCDGAVGADVLGRTISFDPSDEGVASGKHADPSD